MKLYYSPGACSLSPHIVLREAALPFDLVLASTKTKKLPDGTDYLKINPKGYVPCLELDTGERLTEGPAIVQYIADLVPASNLAPPNGTLPRYRLQEWLNYITSEVHKSFGVLFTPITPDNYKPIVLDRLLQRMTFVDAALGGEHYLLGRSFSVADAYLFAVTRWAPRAGLDLGPLGNVKAFMARVAERPAVREALRVEGLA